METPPRPQQNATPNRGSNNDSRITDPTAVSTVDLTGDTDSEPSQSQEIQRPVVEKRFSRPGLFSGSHNAVNSPRFKPDNVSRSTPGSGFRNQLRQQIATPSGSGLRATSAQDIRMVSSMLNVCHSRFLALHLFRRLILFLSLPL